VQGGPLYARAHLEEVSPMRRAAALLFALALAPACSGGGGGGGDDTSVDADPGAPDARPDGWLTLISSSWEIAPGEEYRCERLTITEDVWIKNFRSVIPLGHHHAVLTLEDSPGQPDGQVVCDAGTNAPLMIYGSAPGTEDITMPDGVAVKVPAGSQLNLNLHLYNTQPSTDLAGVSEILYQPVAEAEIPSTVEAEVVLMGSVSFTVDPGTDTVTGSCSMTGPTTLFMTNPHMHKLGAHAVVTARRAAGDVVVHDGPYDFMDQRFYPIDPEVPMETGDSVEIVCTYNNDTGAAVPFGDSTDQEMCFATTYRYPKLSGSFGAICVF
jgi:hypothetical protein